MNKPTRSPAARILGFLLAALVLACPARAQDDDLDEDDPLALSRAYMSGEVVRYRPDISRSDVTFFARMARLSAEQRDAALELHSSYAERYRAAAKKLQDYEDALTNNSEARLYNDERLEERLKPVREDFRKYETKLEEALLADMKTVLTDDQQGRWEWFERRAKWNLNNWGLGVSGHGLPDLAYLAHRALGNEAASDELLETLARFYTDTAGLKEEFAAAQQAWIRQAEQPAENEEGEADDAPPAPDLKAEGRKEFRRRGVELAQRADSKIRGLMPADQAEAFEEQYLTQMTRGLDVWGWMGRPEESYAKALKLESLTAEQRAGLGAAQAEARRESIAKMRAALADHLKESDKKGEFDFGDQMQVMGRMQQMMTAQKATLSKIRGILTPEQQVEAGPPIEKLRVKPPNFDNEDEPAPEIPERSRFMPDIEGALGVAAVNDLDLAFLKRAAPLSDDQYAAAKDLFASYTSRNRLAAKKMAAWQQAVSERMMQGEMPDFLDKSQMRAYLKYHSYIDRIKSELLADVRDLLTEEQSAAYDALKRRVKRKVLRETEMQVDALAAQVDLVSVVEGVFVNEEAPGDLREVLDRYEADAAPAIDRINAFKDQETERAQKMAQGGGAIDMGDMMGFFNNIESQARKLALEVRDLNLRTFRELVPKMPDDRRAEFEEAFYHAADPSLRWSLLADGGSTPRGLFDEAAALGDLTPEQTQALRAEVGRNAAAAAEVLRESFELQLEGEKPDQKSWDRMRNRDFRKIRERQEALRKSSDEALERMLAVLTPEQQSRLPKPYRPTVEVERPRFEEE